MTEKQKTRVTAIIGYFGWAKVESYIQYFDKGADLGALTNNQAQKIITGLGSKIPRKPIMGIYGRA